MEFIGSGSMAFIIGVILITGVIQKNPVFTQFTAGALEGLKTTLTIAPSIIGLVLMVSLMQNSGIFMWLSETLNPLCSYFGFPSQVLPLALIRPISGSGALAVLNNILTENGADSVVGKVASVMMGSTETTFYTIATYFGSINVNKTGYTIPCALLADLTGIIMSVITVTLILG